MKPIVGNYSKIFLRNMSTPARGKKAPLTKEQIEHGLRQNEKFKKYSQTIKSAKPMSIFTNHLPKSEGVEPNSREIAFLSGMPEEHLRRTVIIEPRPLKSVQQGDALSHQWIVSWPHQQKWTNPLMGWTSSADPMSATRLVFDNKEEAISYAERTGLKYDLKQPTSFTFKKLGPKKLRYSYNFLPEPTRKRLKLEGVKSKIFANPNYGNSNWFMPLNYHGTAPVEQHGPSPK